MYKTYIFHHDCQFPTDLSWPHRFIYWLMGRRLWLSVSLLAQPLGHLAWEGKGGGIHKRHLVFDLIKVEELATHVYLLVDG